MPIGLLIPHLRSQDPERTWLAVVPNQVHLSLDGDDCEDSGEKDRGGVYGTVLRQNQKDPVIVPLHTIERLQLTSPASLCAEKFPCPFPP